MTVQSILIILFLLEVMPYEFHVTEVEDIQKGMLRVSLYRY